MKNFSYQVEIINQALREVEKLVAEQVKTDSLKAENEAIKAKSNLQKINEHHRHQMESNKFPDFDKGLAFGKYPK